MKMKKVYQYKAEALNFKTEEMHSGCFSIREDAYKFISDKRDGGCTECSITSGMGSSIYGTWTGFFDADKYIKDAGTWWAA